MAARMVNPRSAVAPLAPPPAVNPVQVICGSTARTLETRIFKPRPRTVPADFDLKPIGTDLDDQRRRPKRRPNPEFVTYAPPHDCAVSQGASFVQLKPRKARQELHQPVEAKRRGRMHGPKAPGWENGEKLSDVTVSLRP
jgi:hypothetical protein